MRKYFIPIIFAALISSVSFPMMDAFAGLADPRFEDNTVHASWLFDFEGDRPADTFSSDSSEFTLFPDIPEPIGGCSDALCTFTIPNFVDDLNTKLIIVDVIHGPDAPSNLQVTCVDEGDLASDGQLVKTEETSGFTQWEIECHPNPDWEIIQFQRTADTGLLQVTIWTTSFGEPTQVAGQLLPLDSTALFLAGIQSMTVWMVPTILGLAGFGVYLVKFRANRG